MNQKENPGKPVTIEIEHNSEDGPVRINVTIGSARNLKGDEQPDKAAGSDGPSDEAGSSKYKKPATDHSGLKGEFSPEDPKSGVEMDCFQWRQLANIKIKSNPAIFIPKWLI